MISIHDFAFNPLRTRCCVVWDDSTKACAIIDPGCCDDSELGGLRSFIEERGLSPEYILLTHGHFDHIFGVQALADNYGIPVYMNGADAFLVDAAPASAATFGIRCDNGFDFQYINVDEGDTFRIGSIILKAIHTPGHTPGGICYYDEADAVLFCGDTLFAGSIGRTDLPGGDYDSLIKSIMDKLMGLPGDVTFFPGHGPSSTIGREATANPFLIPFNEPESDWDNLDALGLER